MNHPLVFLMETTEILTPERDLSPALLQHRCENGWLLDDRGWHPPTQEQPDHDLVAGLTCSS